MESCSCQREAMSGCQCSEIYGTPCQQEPAELATIQWVEPWQRGTHDAAPHPGMWKPLRLHPDCLAAIEDAISEWPDAEYFDLPGEES
jgi:hypothetical protein